MAEEKAAKRARKAFSANFDFTSAEEIDPALSWNNPPASATLDSAGLTVVPKPGTDYWRKPFRDPPADRHSGHGLLYSVPAEAQKCVATTTFTLKEKVQFDQAGLMVYIDDSHWLKAGIEQENGVPNMSCVATDGMSDWNYRVWSTAENVEIRVTLTLYPNVCECLVEFKAGDGNWTFLREAPLTGGPDGIKVGPMCCSPKLEDGGDAMEAIFKSFSIEGE